HIPTPTLSPVTPHAGRIRSHFSPMHGSTFGWLMSVGMGFLDHVVEHLPQGEKEVVGPCPLVVLMDAQYPSSFGPGILNAIGRRVHPVFASASRLGTRSHLASAGNQGIHALAEALGRGAHPCL